MFLMLSCSSFISCGLVRGCLWRSRYLRPGRPISVSAVPFGPGIDIWRSCRVIGALMRSLCLLRGALLNWCPITAGFGTLGGKSVVMALLPGS